MKKIPNLLAAFFLGCIFMLVLGAGISLVYYVGTFSGNVPNVLNVKVQYGAVGDGVTDDTAAIQSALNDWTNKCLPVYFPVGKYKISSGLIIWPSTQTGNFWGTNHFVMYGDGTAQSLIDARLITSGSAITMYEPNATLGGPPEMEFHMKDFTLLGPVWNGNYDNPGWSENAGNSSSGITMGKSFTTPGYIVGDFSAIENLRVDGFARGIVVSNWDGLLIQNCHIAFHQTNAIHAFHCDNLTIIGCNVSEPFSSPWAKTFFGIRLEQETVGTTIINTEGNGGHYLWADRCALTAINADMEGGLCGTADGYVFLTNQCHSTWIGCYDNTACGTNAVFIHCWNGGNLELTIQDMRYSSDFQTPMGFPNSPGSPNTRPFIVAIDDDNTGINHANFQYTNWVPRIIGHGEQGSDLASQPWWRNTLINQSYGVNTPEVSYLALKNGNTQIGMGGQAGMPPGTMTTNTIGYMTIAGPEYSSASYNLPVIGSKSDSTGGHILLGGGMGLGNSYDMSFYTANNLRGHVDQNGAWYFNDTAGSYTWTENLVQGASGGHLYVSGTLDWGGGNPNNGIACTTNLIAKQFKGSGVLLTNVATVGCQTNTSFSLGQAGGVVLNATNMFTVIITNMTGAAQITGIANLTGGGYVDSGEIFWRNSGAQAFNVTFGGGWVLDKPEGLNMVSTWTITNNAAGFAHAYWRASGGLFSNITFYANQ